MDSNVDHQFTIADLDFVVPCTWEGSRDQLHISDEFAQGEGHPGRLFSGTAGLALVIAQLSRAEGWEPPHRLSWQFNAPIYLGNEVVYRTRSLSNDSRQIEVTVGDHSVASGEIWTRPSGDQPRLPDSGAEITRLTRTLGNGDRDLFGWWTSKSVGQLDLPAGEQPWPVLILIASGLVGNLQQFAAGDLSAVLRAYDWSFVRAPQVGETIVISLTGLDCRRSNSKPDWTVCTASLILRGGGDMIATSSFTVLCRGEPRL